MRHPFQHTRRLLARHPAAICVLLMSCGATAEDFPTSVRNRTAVQLVALVEEASAQSMIIEDLRVRATRATILFDVTFRRNSDRTGWLVLVNVDVAKVKSAAAEYEAAGYVRAVERAVNFRGGTFHTVVWTKKNNTTTPLRLPAGPVPVNGEAHMSLKPLDELMTSFVQQHNAAGATLAIAKNGCLVYARGFGYADAVQKQPMRPDSMMRIASTSKSITGVAVMRLVQQGLLSPDDEVLPLLQKARYPRLKFGADKRWNDITVNQLLHHCGGFDKDINSDPMFQVVDITRQRKLKHMATQADIIRHQLTQPLDFDPGSRYAYCNIGYCILGRVIEVVSGLPYHKFVQTQILTPCGMQRTRPGRTRMADRADGEVRYHMQQTSVHAPFWSALERPRRDGRLKLEEVESPYGQWSLEVMDSHAGWLSSAPDLLRFVVALDAGTDRASEPLLTEESLQQMVRRPDLKDSSHPSFWYGYGWQVRPSGRSGKTLDSHTIWHSGALAGSSTLLVRRGDGFSWAVLFNTDESKGGQRLAGLIDPLLQRAVNAVDNWPDVDLFERW